MNNIIIKMNKIGFLYKNNKNKLFFTKKIKSFPTVEEIKNLKRFIKRETKNLYQEAIITIRFLKKSKLLVIELNRKIKR